MAAVKGQSMHREFKRLKIELALFNARRRAAEYRPFSPAWDAAVAAVEDLERDLWRLHETETLAAIQTLGTPEPARS